MKVKAGTKDGKKAGKDQSSEASASDQDDMLDGAEGVKKPKSEITTFSTYISRVKKQVHPSLGISKSSMKILESFVEDFFDRICRQGSSLMTSTGNKTLRSQDILAAIQIVLPGELKKHALQEAEKAMSFFTHATTA